MAEPALPGPASDGAVVWFGDGSAAEGDGSQAWARLQTWAKGRGLRLFRAEERERVPRAIPWDAEGVVEEALARARDGLQALDGPAVDAAVAAALAALERSPELPHGAWLLAEVERTWAARLARVEPRDPTGAAMALGRAAALDGGRALGVGETRDLGVPADTPASLTVRLVLEGTAEGTPSDLQLEVDGQALPTGPLAGNGRMDMALKGGPHQVRLLEGGALLWATWVPSREALRPGASRQAAEGIAVVPVTLPPPPPCSLGDLRGPKACPSWLSVRVAKASGAGTALPLSVATCRGPTCGAFTVVGGALAEGEGDHRGGWPAWATWTLVGVGLVTGATAAFLVASPGEPENRPRLVGGGVTVH